MRINHFTRALSPLYYLELANIYFVGDPHYTGTHVQLSLLDFGMLWDFIH